MKCFPFHSILAAASIIVCAASVARSTTLEAPHYAFTTLVTFNGMNGANPYAGLTIDSGGNLYGTTVSGGPNNAGTVFQLAAGSHAFMTRATFNNANGQDPYGGLTIDASGNLYGTTNLGGDGGNANNGTVFEVAAGSSSVTDLVSFTSSFTQPTAPYDAPILDKAGNLYATSQEGGSGQSYGTVFEVAAGTHALTTLVTFNSTNGKYPIAGLVADSSGNLYGTTGETGTNDGTVFKVAADTHTLTTLATFTGANGASPGPGNLIADAGGNLYGTTVAGGLMPNGATSQDGIVYELVAATQSLKTLYTFSGLDGSDPIGGLMFGPDGKLFGTTNEGGEFNDGTVFELDPASGDLATLFSFNGTDGRIIYSGLTADAAGNLYGTTWAVGENGDGSVFELSPVPEPSSWLLAIIGGIGLVIACRRHQSMGFRC